MDRLSRNLGIAMALLFTASTILAAISWSRVVHFRLPMPSWVVAISTLLPFLSILFVPSLQVLLNRYIPSNRQTIRPYVAMLITVPLYVVIGVILGLASEHVSASDVLHCRMETQWTRFFSSHNQDAIRSIQTALQCCGYNSIRDRAWPFPGHGVDVNDCPRSLDFHQRCADVWIRQQLAAGRLATASGAGSLISVVLLSIILAHRRRLSRDFRAIMPSAGQNGPSSIRPTNAEDSRPSQRQIEPYTDQDSENEALLAERGGFGDEDENDSGDFGGNSSTHINLLR